MIRIAARFFIAMVMLAIVGVYSAEAATYKVTKTADTNDGVCDADCSLREAIAAANGSVDNDTIVFDLLLFSSPRTITLSGSELVVANNGSLTILGPGAYRLTISGNNASRILVSGANVVVNIHNLSFTAGNGVGATNTGRGGAIYNVGGTMLISNSILTGNSAANGGALNNAASAAPAVPANLTIDNCIISNNSSTSSGAALQNFSTSTLHMRNTTVNNNNSTGTGIAGAFQANGTVTITNSTFSGNSTAGTGAGVYFNGSSLVMTNSTLAGNTSALGGGGLHRTATTPVANVRNTIIADNAGAAATPDVSGTITSQGNNIIENIGTSVGWLMSDQQNVDPKLSPLGFHGGFGMTHLPLAASTAINMGENCVVTSTCAAANPPVNITTDERGATRPSGANVDIGAVEAAGDYFAVLPSAFAGLNHSFTLVPVNGPFTYSVNSGSLGGLILSGTTSTTLSGIPVNPGRFDALVHIVGPSPDQAFQNYRINVVVGSTYSVTGRVITSTGEGVSGASVVLTSLNGGTYTAITNGFGYYRMDGLIGGLNGTMTVSSKKGLTFDPRAIAVIDVIEGFDMQAQP